MQFNHSLKMTEGSSEVTDEPFLYRPGSCSFSIYIPKSIIATIIFLTIAITGIIGNSIVILAIVLSRKLWSTLNWFVLNLAVVDLLTSLCIIFPSASYHSPLSFAGRLFDIVMWVTYAFFAMSLTTHAFIAVTIWYLFTRNEVKSTRNTCIMIALCWLLPIITVCVSFITGGLNHCKIAPILEAVFITTHFLVIATAYIKVWRFVARHGKKRIPEGTEPKLDRKLIAVTKNLFLILLAFIVCFIPYASKAFYEVNDPVLVLLITLLYFSSCINPIIYAGRIRAFREVMVCIIRCRFGSIPMPTACLRRMRHTNQNEVQELSVIFTVSN